MQYQEAKGKVYVVKSNIYGGNYVETFILSSDVNILNKVANISGENYDNLSCYVLTTSDKEKAAKFFSIDEAEFFANHWNVKGEIEIY